MRRFIPACAVSAALLVFSFGVGNALVGSIGGSPGMARALPVAQAAPAAYADGPTFGFTAIEDAITGAEQAMLAMDRAAGPLVTNLSTDGWTYGAETGWVCCYAED